MVDGPTGRIVVTGAGGYVGGRLVEHLSGRDFDVVPVVRQGRGWLPAGVAVDLVSAPDSDIDEVLSPAEVVVHLAGASEVTASVEPDLALSETIVATRRVAAAAARTGTQLVYVSTVHVYGPVVSSGVTALPEGDSSLDPIVIDETCPAEPRHPYAIARRTGELLAQSSGGLAPIILRLSNAVGAPVDRRVDRWTLVASDLCAAAARGEDLVLRSSGMQTRDFVPLSTVCTAIEACASGVVAPDIYNLSSGEPRTLVELAGMVASVAEALTSRRPAIVRPDHEGPSPRPVEIDNRRLERQVGELPTDIEDELRGLIVMCMEGSGVR